MKTLRHKIGKQKKLLLKNLSVFLFLITFIGFFAMVNNKNVSVNANINTLHNQLSLPTMPPMPTMKQLPTMPPMPTFPVDIDWHWCGCDDHDCCKPTKTPTITSTPVPTMPEVTQIPSVYPTPTNTPSNGGSSDGGSSSGGTSSSGSDGGSSSSNDSGGGQILYGIMTTAIPGKVLGGSDTFNPLLFGIKNTRPRILAAKIKKLPKTAGNDEPSVYSDNQIIADSLIMIPKLNINQPLTQGEVINDQVLIGTANEIIVYKNNPNIFYGHNNNQLFGQLYKLTQNDIIIIMRDKTVKTYAVVSVARTPENNTGMLQNDNRQDQITLFTCDHYNSYLRLVIKAIEIK